MRSQLIFTILLAFACSVQAAPVTWHLNGVVLEQQQPDSTFELTSLTGSFDYDADTNMYSDVFIQSEYGYYFVGTTYTENAGTLNKLSAVESPSSGGVIFNVGAPQLDCPGYCDYVLILSFGSALTNSGGTVSLDGQEALDGGPGWGIFTDRDIISGSVSTVPVPAAFWLFASALAGLGWTRAKNTV